MGIELRGAIDDDLAVICDVINRAEHFDGIPRVHEEAELREELAELSLADDVRLAEVDGAVAGCAYILHLPSEVREERAYVFGSTVPEHRRRGVGSALMAWAVERGAALLRSSHRDLPRYLRVEAFECVDGAHALLARCGFRPVRYMDELLRPLVDLPPVPAIDGIRIVPWPEGRDEELRGVKNTAFADHWGSTPTHAVHWAQHLHGYGSAPSLSFVAVDAADRAVAVCISHRYEADDELLGRRDGWIATLATLAEWRGRGVASALIATALHAYADAGLTHASIGVDSENPTGAARLYRSLGFEPNLRSIVHQIAV